MSWTPGGDVLFDLLDTATNVTRTCAYTPADGDTVKGYTFALDPVAPPAFDITATDSGVVFAVPAFTGLFEPEFIDYLDAGKVCRVTAWDALPEGKEIIEFRPTGTHRISYTLTVTATVEQQTELGDTATVEVSHAWLCIVTHDYSPDRDRLLDYINARRDT